MTVAQLVHSTGLPWPDRWRSRRRSLRPSSNALLWRAIATGLGFGIVGLLLMALALEAAGTAPAPRRADADIVGTASRPTPHRLEIYGDSSASLTGAMPVP